MDESFTNAPLLLFALHREASRFLRDFKPYRRFPVAPVQHDLAQPYVDCRHIREILLLNLVDSMFDSVDVKVLVG